MNLRWLERTQQLCTGVLSTCHRVLPTQHATITSTNMEVDVVCQYERMLSLRAWDSIIPSWPLVFQKIEGVDCRRQTPIILFSPWCADSRRNWDWEGKISNQLKSRNT